MPTCTRGTSKKTVSGKVKIKVAGQVIQTVDLTNEEGSEQWNNCRCAKGTYQENVCVTATDTTKGEKVAGSHEPARLVTIEWDLTIDTERNITNCDYDCVVSAPEKGQFF